MTKAQAIQALEAGHKVTHYYFEDHEWISMVGNMMLLEDGVQCTSEEFWKHRTTAMNPEWDRNWSLWVPQDKKYTDYLEELHNDYIAKVTESGIPVWFLDLYNASLDLVH